MLFGNVKEDYELVSPNFSVLLRVDTGRFSVLSSDVIYDPSDLSLIFGFPF